MAIYHLTTRTGKAHQGRAVRHGGYIRREGIYSDRNDMAFREVGNLPAWATGDPAAFWAACDQLERSNGRAYREIEIAIPRELSREQQIELVRHFCREQFGNRHAYEAVIHDNGTGNPHAHIMFSERQLDGLERDMETFFKRPNKKNPERGGCAKDDGWRGTYHNKPERLLEIRSRWAELQNMHLERAGELARVDHRTLEAQGIEREAQIHVGPRTAEIEEIHAERFERNEAIKRINQEVLTRNEAVELVNQEAQTRAELADAEKELSAAQVHLAEITATLKEIEAKQEAAKGVSASLKEVAKSAEDINERLANLEALAVKLMEQRAVQAHDAAEPVQTAEVSQAPQAKPPVVHSPAAPSTSTTQEQNNQVKPELTKNEPVADLDKLAELAKGKTEIDAALKDSWAVSAEYNRLKDELRKPERIARDVANQDTRRETLEAKRKELGSGLGRITNRKELSEINKQLEGNERTRSMLEAKLQAERARIPEIQAKMEALNPKRYETAGKDLQDKIRQNRAELAREYADCAKRHGRDAADKALGKHLPTDKIESIKKEYEVSQRKDNLEQQRGKVQGRGGYEQ